MKKETTSSIDTISYVYILKCADDSLYTGYTNKPFLRLKNHNNGKASKYTRGRTPVKFLFLKAFPNKILATRFEYKIKKLTKAKKEALICGNIKDFWLLDE